MSTIQEPDDSLSSIRLLTQSPYHIHLKKIPWAIFGTITWYDEGATLNNDRAEGFRYRDFTHLILKASQELKLRHKKLAIYRKSEFGAGRGHSHFLIAKQGTEKIPPSLLAHTLQKLWVARRGRAEIVPFDDLRQLKGTDYASKVELDALGNGLWASEDISRPLYKLFQENANNAEQAERPLVPSISASI